MEISRVVIFGHKPVTHRTLKNPFGRTHTHSYIHNGFYRAFEFLGFETLWLDASDALDDFPLKGTLFVTEDQVDEHIPIGPGAYYVTHSSSKSKYEESGVRRLNLCNYVYDLNSGVSYNYPGSFVEKINNVTFFDAKNSALYQPWATNLLPTEIDPADFVTFDASKDDIYYVGTIGHDNIKSRFVQFSESAAKSGKRTILKSGVSDEVARNLIRRSFISADLRGDWHLERGYIPCRLWKNLSYGQVVGSNSPLLRKIFEDRVVFSDDAESLFEITRERAHLAGSAVISDAMKWVKLNHTYVNRAQMLVKILNEMG